MTTFCTMRAPGMGWMQMPLFSWSMLIATLMLFISIPAFGIGLIQVLLDRTIGTVFYEVAGGGDPLLWSHLFWYFGHPEVYVVVLPAFGVISEVLSTSARRTIFGYKSMVFALAGAIRIFGVKHDEIIGPNLGPWSDHCAVPGVHFNLNDSHAAPDGSCC